MTGIAKIPVPHWLTLRTLDTLSTLCAGRLGQRAAVFARRAARPAQVVAARWPSVVGPRLQIRLARFDSGPRLQYRRITDSSVVRFFSAAHFLHGAALAAGYAAKCLLEPNPVHRLTT